jgi:hypothetical protein
MDAWFKITARATVDTLFATPAVDSATRRLYGNPFSVPPSMDDRIALLDVTDTMSTIAFGGEALDMEYATAKYGRLLNYLVANPFVQDQMLGDPSRWAKVVKFARHAVEDRSDSDVKRASVRTEAVKFLHEYDVEVKKCAPRMATAAPFAGVRLGFLICDYPQENFERHLYERR